VIAWIPRLRLARTQERTAWQDGGCDRLAMNEEGSWALGSNGGAILRSRTENAQAGWRARKVLRYREDTVVLHGGIDGGGSHQTVQRCI